MPTAKVKGKIKHFPYTEKGYKDAAKARKKSKPKNGAVKRYLT